MSVLTALHRRLCAHTDTAKRRSDSGDRVYLECLTCGHTSPGWEIAVSVRRELEIPTGDGNAVVSKS